MRAAIPPPERQKEIAQLLESAYQLTALEGNSKKQAAIKQLMEASRDEQMSDDERYVVLMTVISLATEVGDVGSWREAVAALVGTFDVETEKEKTRLLSELLRSIRTSLQLKLAVEEAIGISRRAAEQNRFAEAFSLLDLAVAATRRTPNSEGLRKTLVAVRETVAAREKEWKAFQAALAKLDAHADDPLANFTVGRWHVVEGADWETALPFLAKSTDAKWKAAAALEQSSPTDAASQAAIGDAWYAIAEKESGTLKTVLLIHAGRWYEAAQPNLTSALMKQLVAKRLAEVAPLHTAGGTRPGDVPALVPPSAKLSSEWIDLLAMAEGMDWSPRGYDWNDHIEGRATKEGITLKPHWCSRFPCPAIIEGSYEAEFEFTRLEGNDAVGIFFPVQSHNMHLEFGTFHNPHDQIRFIAGNQRDQVAVEQAPSILKANNQKHTVRLKVEMEEEKATLRVDVDGIEKHLTWSGPHSRLVNEERGDWRPTMIRHLWITSMNSKAVFHKLRIRSAGGSIHRDVITDADRAVDFKNGLVRLVGEPVASTSVGWAKFLVNQLPMELLPCDVERLWPLVSRQYEVCNDYYGAHAPSNLKCPIPAGAKSFSVVGYNDASRTAKYLVLVDGKEAYDSGITDLAIIRISLPPKSSLLELVTDPAGGQFRDHTYWCFPRFHAMTADKITDTMLDGKSSALPFAIASGKVGAEALTHNQPIRTLKSAPLHFRDAVPCDEFLYAHAPSSVTYQIPVGMTRFTAVGYNVMSHQAKFEVWADSRQIYESDQAGIVSLDVKLPPGSRMITLKVNPMGTQDADHSIWCYPRLHQK